jgi:hypothetical protein
VDMLELLQMLNFLLHRNQSASYNTTPNHLPSD